MGKHKHSKRMNMDDRYDKDYISLPEYPHILRIVAVPMKTIYINVEADPDTADEYTAKSWCDEVLQCIASKA